MCTVLLPPPGYPIAVNKYVISCMSCVSPLPYVTYRCLSVCLMVIFTFSRVKKSDLLSLENGTDKSYPNVGKD